MTTPDWWTFALLALASWRTFLLLSEDTILDVPRAMVLGYRGWKEGERLPDTFRERTSDFVTCPACLGFWCSVGWFGAWQLWPSTTLWIAALAAISAVVGLIARASD